MQNTWDIDMEVGSPYAFVPIHVPSNNILMIKGCIVSNYTLSLEMNSLKIKQGTSTDLIVE